MMKTAARYHIAVKNAPAPLVTPGRWIISRGDECINCGRCIVACQYGVHDKRAGDPRLLDLPKSDLCRNCFRCILECPVQTLEMSPSAPFAQLGREPYNARVLQSISQQAEDGKVPVSGGGYKGPFSGPGFDSMWTDMSEIVRPTRDGIHGRETISTSVLLGRAPLFVDFEASTPEPLEAPIPILFEVPEGHYKEEDLVSIVLAARQIGTYALMRPWRAPLFEGITSSIIPVRDADADAEMPAGDYPMVELREPTPERVT
ncbi:MAG TPA: 4Fe-4S dicluster domain-containing protein, partial [Planctomycetota bacterium]|nr:4Fe-4S dicluster domain-containing protein [Planctomycetota bacterium]